MFQFVLENNISLTVIIGTLFAVIGLIFRNESQFEHSRDMIYADGFQGASIATLLYVAVIVFHIENPLAVKALKEQANTVALFSVLGCLHFVVQFRRSLK
jgi:hypothetical protein